MFDDHRRDNARWMSERSDDGLFLAVAWVVVIYIIVKWIASTTQESPQQLAAAERARRERELNWEREREIARQVKRHRKIQKAMRRERLLRERQATAVGVR